eukprot:TRINITY_DN50755_c0_g1_i1.p1 TRINITY_DN50755_c0_g1~~TRINITY_DN50755_c0_g1_i1.p1  ORF type:complete len:254 (+),score=90.29 TRINITY_DN50755_c0_g1_i1:79-762(+)
MPEPAAETEDVMEQCGRCLDSWDKLADEAAGSAVVAALVWVFALSWVLDYDPSTFVHPEDGAKDSMHSAFIIILSITIGCGGLGVMILSVYFNAIKLMLFQLQKRGKYTVDQVRHMCQFAVSLDFWTFPARFLGLMAAFPLFMVCATILLWAKVNHAPLDFGGKGIAVTCVVLSSVLTAFGCVGVLVISCKYNNFRKNLGLGEMGETKDWWRTAFNGSPQVDECMQH